MQVRKTIAPCIWFDTQAEEAADLYTSTFPNSRITAVTRYGEAGKEIHGRPVGSVLTVNFELDGQPFTALNGGPLFQLTAAVSFQIECETQAEVDHYWAKLTEGGDVNAQQCGWLKDRFGVSWQVTPRILHELLHDPTSAGGERTMAALLKMQKLDIEALKRAHAG